MVVTVTVYVPYTSRTVLYGSSCSAVQGQPPDSSTTTSTTSTSTSTSTSYFVSTLTSSSLVVSDGTTYTSLITSTTTGIADSPPPPNNTSTSNNTGAIVGGTLGGITALVLLTLLTWKMIQKSHRFDNLFNPDDKYLKKGPTSDPYQYGPVGQQDNQPIISPPTSPALQPSNLGNDITPFNNPNPGSDVPGQYNGSANNGVNVGHTGNDPGLHPGNDIMYNAPNHTSVYGLRDPGFTPLLVGVAGAAAAGVASARRNDRPSTSSSSPSQYSSGSDLIGSQSSRTNYPQQYNSYPPALATYAQQQQGFLSPAGHGQPNLYKTAHNSPLSPPSNMPGNTAGTSGSSNFPQMGMAAAMPVQGQYPQQPFWQAQQQQAQRYEDPFARTVTSGSSTQESPNRSFQVMNADTSTSVDGPSIPGLTIMGPSGSQTDGKGRQMNLQGEKAALVHLDGGAYQDTDTPAPPAYME